LRAHGSPFLRIELLLALLAFPLVAAGCGPREVWGTPVEALGADLAQARYGSLSAVDFPSSNPDEALALAPEAPYYLSFVFEAMRKEPQALAMLELAWSRSPSPWKEDAGVLLVERYNAEKSWDRAASVARRLIAAAGGGNTAADSIRGNTAADSIRGNTAASVEQRARRALVEALYWTKDDAAVLEEAARLVTPDPEVLLFRAVSSLRLGLPPAHDLVMGLFLDVRTSPLHGRFASFLAGEPSYLPLFSKDEQAVIAGRSALVQGAWAPALARLESALDAADPAPLARSALLADMGNAYAFAGRYSAGAAFMEKLSARLSGQPRADAIEQAGKLYRRLRNYGRAMSLLHTVAGEAPTLDQRDRARWFILDMLFALSPADLAARVGEEAAHWTDPSFFADILEDRISDEVSARRWTTLAALRAALAGTGPDSILAELDYVIARAWQEGRIRRLSGTSAGELFADAVRRDPMGYYGILSASMLGQVPDRAVAGTAPDVTGRAVPLDPLIMGFLAYGLRDEAYGRLWAMRQDLTDVQVLDAARSFAAAGDLRGSLYFTGALARRRRLTRDELELYYPKGYGTLLEPLAAGAGIPDHVLYGLVREESYFDAGIVSSAGAVGLSQLMPVTANQIAGRLKMVDPDLRDPATNLTIGVRHLQELLKNVDNQVKALLAYNAGLSRLRQWERAAANLPPDLLVESVPIVETRGYVRKILVSAVMYAFLYRDIDPRVAALGFFGIRQGPLEPVPTAPSGARPSPSR